MEVSSSSPVVIQLQDGETPLLKRRWYPFAKKRCGVARMIRRLFTIRALLSVSAGLLWIGATAVRADVINLGIVSFDVFLPPDVPDGNPGVNALNISNMTGTFSAGSDFPAITPLTFQSATLTLSPAESNPVPALGDVGPGLLLNAFFNPWLLAPDTDASGSARFQATLDKTVFSPGDGSVFTADSSLLNDVTLLPSNGTNLTAGTDFALITVLGTISAPAVPEPARWSLLQVAMAWLGYQAWRRHKSEVVPVNSD